ncbi:MAG: 2-oxoacid:ferredoxin oxidoreductase subunit gamma [Clostridiales bacterium]|uniref:2-oxoacid:acceptor oxidoreductase family protein n=1 Tax=Aminipila sp. TaxID=2060095 RepID=UPI001DB82E6B|nr:2-oxoacid:acceptor oxidoreductase family protein [Aminipila sp.]MBE6033986.1 2-oxoacid:ferredoxin oxidoreductase subunit gamma [Clostridiales bacterium]
MSTKKIFVAGFGGQGILLIGQMLSYAAMFEGKEVSWMPSYGPEMRGGTANCTVCISEAPIASPLVTACDVLVAMNGPSLEKFESMLVPGGDLFINSSIVPQKASRTDVHVYYVDCNEITEKKLGNPKAANMVMLGAIINVTNVVDKLTMEKVFQKVMTGEKAKLIPLNMRALDAWEK